MCVCVRERESVCVCVNVSVCACVCVYAGDASSFYLDRHNADCGEAAAMHAHHLRTAGAFLDALLAALLAALLEC